MKARRRGRRAPPRRTPPGPPRGGHWGVRLPALLPWLAVAGVAVATYLTALPNGFVSDAGNLIPGNPSLLNSREWLAWFSRPYFWGSNIRDQFHYRPLTVLSYVVTLRAAGPSPLPFVLGNLALHAAASLLVLAVGRHLLGAAAGLLGALLFAVHPLHTEAVAWIGGRPDLLATVFALGAALGFLRATEPGARRPAVWAAGAAVSFFGALLSKEHTILLPLWLGLVWLLDRRRLSGRWAAVALGGCLVAFAAFLVLRAGVVASLPKILTTSGRHFGSPWAPWRWLTGLAIAGKYAALFLWPRRLTFDHSLYSVATVQPERLEPLEVVWGGVAIAGVLAATVWALRARPGLALTLAFIPVTYVVVSAFPFTPGLFVAERVTYLPSAGAALAAGWLLLRAGQWAVGFWRGGGAPAPGQGEPALDPSGFSVAGWARTGWRGRAAAGILLGLLAALAARTAVRNLDWRTNETLSLAAVAVSDDSALALRGLAYEAYRRGDDERARALFEQSIGLNPRTWAPYVLLAEVYTRNGELDRAIDLYRRAVAHLPERVEPLHNLAGLLWQAGRVEEAEPLFRKAIRTHPNFFPSRLALGGIFVDSGRPAEALEHFRVASQLKPDNPLGWFGMARAALVLGRTAEARTYAEKARAQGFALPEEFARALERAK